MADATTTNQSFTQPEVGGSVDTWGTKLNTNWSDLDAYLGAVADKWVPKSGGGFTGAVTFASTVGITGLITAAGGMSLTAGDLAVTANQTIGGTLGVTGAATVGGSLGVTGNLSAADLTLTGDLTASAASAALASLATTGAIAAGSTLSSAGLATLESLAVTNAAAIGGALGVTGLATLTGGFAAGANSSVAGNLTATGQLRAQTAVAIDDASLGTGGVGLYTSGGHARLSGQTSGFAEGNKLIGANIDASGVMSGGLELYGNAGAVAAVVVDTNSTLSQTDEVITKRKGDARYLVGTSYLDLDDTPAAFVASRYPRVNSAGTALEFVTGTGSGPTDLVGLSDTPNAYAGAALQLLAVNAGETAMEFIASLYDALVAESNVTQHEAALAIATSQLTGTLLDATVAETNVTQHQAALSLTESQISDLQAYLTDITGESVASLSDVTITTPAAQHVLAYDGVSAWVNRLLAAGDITSGTFADVLIAESSVTQHQAALSITESQISDFGTYQPASYTPTGTGAVSRAVEGKLGEWVSATDFGAVGDGSTDDSTALDLAIAAFPAEQIWLPAGIYVYDGAGDLNMHRFAGPGMIKDATTEDLYGTFGAFGGGAAQVQGGAVLGESFHPLSLSGIPSANAVVFEPGGVSMRVAEGGYSILEPQRGGTNNVLEVHTGPVKGKFTTASGTDEITLVSGSGVGGYLIGLPILVTWQDRAAHVYSVAARVGDVLTLTELDGSAVSFADNATVYCFMNSTPRHVQVTVSGNTCSILRNPAYEDPTYVFSGYSITNKYVHIALAGTMYLVTAVDTNPDPTLYHQVLTLAGSPPAGTQSATQFHFWDSPVKIRSKPMAGGGDEGGLDKGYDSDGFAYLQWKSSDAALARPLKLGVQNTGNMAFFLAETDRQAVHFADSDDFWGVVDPELAGALNAADDFKMTVRRDNPDAHTGGGTTRSGYGRFWGLFNDTAPRGLDIEGYNDSGGLNLQGITSADAVAQLRLQARGGQLLAGALTTTRSEDFVFDGSMALTKSGVSTLYMIDRAAGKGGRLIGDSADSISIRSGLTGFVNYIVVNGASSRVDIGAGSTLVARLTATTADFQASNIQTTGSGKFGKVATNDQTGTSYTLVLGDAGLLVYMNNAAANVVTIPANASVAYPVGTAITIIQEGAGVTTITADTGVTLNGVSAGSGAINNQFSGVTLVKRGTNTWVAHGDLGTVA